jgi:hypothetical protein
MRSSFLAMEEEARVLAMVDRGPAKVRRKRPWHDRLRRLWSATAPRSRRAVDQRGHGALGPAAR